MRENKFRGKYVESGEWIYGDLIWSMYIYPTSKGEPIDMGTYLHVEALEVDPKTVGRYIGIKDKNDVEIYEGDIIQKLLKDNNSTTYEMVNCVVEFNRHGCYMFRLPNGGSTGNVHQDSLINEVVGNQFDNPQLLKPNEK